MSVKKLDFQSYKDFIVCKNGKKEKTALPPKIPQKTLFEQIKKVAKHRIFYSFCHFFAIFLFFWVRIPLGSP